MNENPVKKRSTKEQLKEQKFIKQDPQYFYKLALSKGVDYNYYGDWQKSYAKMVLNICEVIKHTGKAKPSLLDVGCGCGVNTRAFRDLGVFNPLQGCDTSGFMIDIGKKTHGFSDTDLFVADASHISPVKSNSVDFLHCSNMLEHCEESDIRPILNEFKRVIHPNGLIFLVLPTVTDAHPEEKIKENEDHYTIKPFRWWENVIEKQFDIQPDIYEKFKTDKHSPDDSKKSFYDHYGTEWTLFLLTRR